jgi:hypothetical protein
MRVGNHAASARVLATKPTLRLSDVPTVVDVASHATRN